MGMLSAPGGRPAGCAEGAPQCLGWKAGPGRSQGWDATPVVLRGNAVEAVGFTTRLGLGGIWVSGPTERPGHRRRTVRFRQEVLLEEQGKGRSRPHGKHPGGVDPVGGRAALKVSEVRSDVMRVLPVDICQLPVGGPRGH